MTLEQPRTWREDNEKNDPSLFWLQRFYHQYKEFAIEKLKEGDIQTAYSNCKEAIKNLEKITMMDSEEKWQPEIRSIFELSNNIRKKSRTEANKKIMVAYWSALNTAKKYVENQDPINAMKAYADMMPAFDKAKKLASDDHKHVWEERKQDVIRRRREVYEKMEDNHYHLTKAMNKAVEKGDLETAISYRDQIEKDIPRLKIEKRDGVLYLK